MFFWLYLLLNAFYPIKHVVRQDLLKMNEIFYIILLVRKHNKKQINILISKVLQREEKNGPT